jgi:hypothetical protein
MQGLARKFREMDGRVFNDETLARSPGSPQHSSLGRPSPSYLIVTSMSVRTVMVYPLER